MRAWRRSGAVGLGWVGIGVGEVRAARHSPAGLLHHVVACMQPSSPQCASWQAGQQWAPRGSGGAPGRRAQTWMREKGGRGGGGGKVQPGAGREARLRHCCWPASKPPCPNQLPRKSSRVGHASTRDAWGQPAQARACQAAATPAPTTTLNTQQQELNTGATHM